MILKHNSQMDSLTMFCVCSSGWGQSCLLSIGPYGVYSPSASLCLTRTHTQLPRDRPTHHPDLTYVIFHNLIWFFLFSFSPSSSLLLCSDNHIQTYRIYQRGRDCPASCSWSLLVSPTWWFQPKGALNNKGIDNIIRGREKGDNPFQPGEICVWS